MSICLIFGIVCIYSVYQKNQLSLAATINYTLCGDNEAWFFADPDFKGQKLAYNPGTNIDLAAKTNLGDKISSLQIGKNVRVKLCDHPNCAGTSFNAVEIVGPYMVSSMPDKGDTFSHIIVYSYNPTTEPRV